MRHLYTLLDTLLDMNVCGPILLCLAALENAAHGAWGIMENMSTINNGPLCQKVKL